MTPENQALLRTYRPALSNMEYVSIRVLSGNNTIWTLCGAANQPFHARAGGREIHVFDPLYYNRNLVPSMLFMMPFRHRIYPRRMLTPHDIAVVRSYFPDSVGVRVYISGLMVFLFGNMSDIRSASCSYWNYAGGLGIGHDVRNIRPLSSPSRSVCVATSPCKVSGLKVRLKDGTEGVTTATHRHVRNPAKSSTLEFLIACAQPAQEWVSKRVPEIIKPLATRKMPNLNSALHRKVDIAGNAATGDITVTYDEPSTFFACPSGYQHDLSLVTGPHLPATSSQDIPMITGWANYEEALDGKPACIVTLNGTTGTKMKQAVVEGTEYFWDARGRVSTSLFWRTEDGFDVAEGESSAVLCLGKPGDSELKAVVFQNYEAPRREWADNERRILTDRRESFMGGFVLPREIRESEIV